MILEELCEIEGGYDPDRLRVCKFLVSAFVDTLEKWHRVVDKNVNMSALELVHHSISLALVQVGVHLAAVDVHLA